MDGKLFGVGAESSREKKKIVIFFFFFSFSFSLMMGIFLVWFGLVWCLYDGSIGWDVHKLPQPTSPTELVLGHVVLFGDSIIWCSVGSWAEREFGIIWCYNFRVIWGC